MPEEKHLPNFLENKGSIQVSSDCMSNIRMGKLAGMNPMKSFEDSNLIKETKVSNSIGRVC